MVRFALLPEDIQYSLCGDFITESLGQVLASVCGGDLAGIQSLIENESADQWVRGAALSASCDACGRRTKEPWNDRELLRQLVSRQIECGSGPNVWDTLVSYSSDLYAEELLDDIKQAYDEGLVDPGYIGLKHVKQDSGTLGKRFRLLRDSARQTIPIDALCRTP